MESTAHALPATPKQIAYARSLAQRNRTLLPWEVQQNRRSLSAWIEAQARLKHLLDIVDNRRAGRFAHHIVDESAARD